MKKILLMVLMLFLLTGCNNSVSFDFKDNIDAKIDLSFTLAEYKAYSERNSNAFENDEEAKSSIEAIRNDNEAFSSNNNSLLNETRFINDGNNYNAGYEFTYTYSNFVYNSVLNSCFEYFGVEDDKDNIYVSLSGKSICAPFKLTIKTKDRMINNNATNVNNDEYTWNVNYNSNNIYFAISKTPMNSSSISMLYVVYFIIGIAIAFVAYILKNKRR